MLLLNDLMVVYPAVNGGVVACGPLTPVASGLEVDTGRPAQCSACHSAEVYHLCAAGAEYPWWHCYPLGKDPIRFRTKPVVLETVISGRLWNTPHVYE